MNYWNEDLLQMVEMYAEEVGYISSEEQLSEHFDSVLEGCCPNFDLADYIAINEAFSDWSDGLCKDGEIHPEQYNNYEYVGKHS